MDPHPCLPDGPKQGAPPTLTPLLPPCVPSLSAVFHRRRWGRGGGGDEKKTNGFMGAFEIPLACSVRDLGTMVILQQEILALCDFLLDKASGDQYYIHKTGMLFAQITCEGFLWYALPPPPPLTPRSTASAK